MSGWPFNKNAFIAIVALLMTDVGYRWGIPTLVITGIWMMAGTCTDQICLTIKQQMKVSNHQS